MRAGRHQGIAKVALAAIIVVILGTVAAIGYVVTSQASTATSSSSSSTPAWLFNGAYVTYFGTTLLAGTPLNVTYKFQVIDFNSTQVEFLDYSSVGGQLNQTTVWTSYSGNTPVNVGVVSEGQTFVREYNTTRLIGGPNGKTYNLIADEYNLQKAANPQAGLVAANLTYTYYYVSKNVAFPIERTTTIVDDIGTTTIDVTLVDTNIPGLTLG